jgi:hypothetical protein
MAASDLSSIAYIVKKLYSNKAPQNLASRDRVFLSMVPKSGGFTGSNLTVALQYGNAMGVSGSLVQAQNIASSTKGVAFTLTRAKKYGICTVDAETIQATKDDEGAFVRALKNEIDSMIDEMGHRLAAELYLDGFGALGQRSSASTNVITLTSAGDVKNFSVGMTVTASPNSNGSSPRTGGTTVAAVDEDTGTVTLTSAAAITSFADSDYLFAAAGAVAGTYTPDNSCVSGLGGWLPMTAPTVGGGDSWFGVDRAADVGRLAGWRVNATNNTIEENLLTLGTKIVRAGGKPDAILMSPANWANLVKSMGTKVLRDQGGTATAGFEYVNFALPSGICKVYADPECPANRGYALEMKSWMLRYLGPGIPHVVMDDGLSSLRQSASDGVEIRGRYWGQLYCVAPGHNGVIAI